MTMTNPNSSKWGRRMFSPVMFEFSGIIEKGDHVFSFEVPWYAEFSLRKAVSVWMDEGWSLLARQDILPHLCAWCEINGKRIGFLPFGKEASGDFGVDHVHKVHYQEQIKITFSADCNVNLPGHLLVVFKMSGE